MGPQFSDKITHWKQNPKWAELLVHCNTSIFHKDTFLCEKHLYCSETIDEDQNFDQNDFETPKIILNVKLSSASTSGIHVNGYMFSVHKLGYVYLFDLGCFKVKSAAKSNCSKYGFVRCCLIKEYN